MDKPYLKLKGPIKIGTEYLLVICEKDHAAFYPISHFSPQIQEAFKDKQIGTTLKYKAIRNPNPSNVELDEGGISNVPQQMEHTEVKKNPVIDSAIAPVTRGAADRVSTNYRLTGFAVHGNIIKANLIRNDDKKVKPVGQLGIADQLMGARIGAEFECKSNQYGPQVGDLIKYAPDVRPGIGPTQDVNLNPYNFTHWHGTLPWEGQDFKKATHSLEWSGRNSGAIKVTLTAETPIFIPSAAEPQKFFNCWDGESERFAIPGSSIKGPVRSLFEVLTNSRCGISNMETLQWHPLYRRRASMFFKVDSMPTESAPGKVTKCRFAFCRWDPDQHRFIIIRVNGLNNPVTQQEINDGRATIIKWRANLYWVDSKKYQHNEGKSHIAYIETRGTFNFSWVDYRRYQSMKIHPHFEKHAENVRMMNTGRTGYVNDDPPEFDSCKDDLFKIAAFVDEPEFAFFPQHHHCG